MQRKVFVNLPVFAGKIATGQVLQGKMPGKLPVLTGNLTKSQVKAKSAYRGTTD